MTFLAQGLRSCRHLTTLNLKCNRIQAEGVKIFVNVLELLLDLEKLYFEGNDISDKGIEALAISQERYTNIHTLCFDGLKVCSEKRKGFHDTTKNEVCDAIKYLINDHILNFKHFCLDINDIKLLADSCTNLQILNLESNEIDSDGVTVLAEGLKCCKNLDVLHLGRNRIGDRGLKSLSKCLEFFCNLREFDLWLIERRLG